MYFVRGAKKTNRRVCQIQYIILLTVINNAYRRNDNDEQFAVYIRGEGGIVIVNRIDESEKTNCTDFYFI